MKIITGILKNKKIFFKKNKFIRPITSYNKKRIFNKICFFKNNNMLDLFSGSGNIGFEFLSNKYKVIFIDNYQISINYIKYNLNLFKIKKKFFFYKKINVIKFLKKNKKKFNIIFIDPPYQYKIIKINKIIDIIYKNKILKKNGLIILSILYKKKNFLKKNFFYCIKNKINGFFFFK